MRDLLCETRCGFDARRALLRGQAPHVFVRCGECGRRGGDRIEAVFDRVQLRLRLDGACKELVVRVDMETPPRLGDPVELRLDLLEPARLGLEARQERTQLARGLAEP